MFSGMELKVNLCADCVSQVFGGAENVDSVMPTCVRCSLPTIRDMVVRDREIRRRRLRGDTLRKIGTEFGISYERVRQITRGLKVRRVVRREWPA